MSSGKRITNDDWVPPGTLVQSATTRGQVVYEVLETRMSNRWLEGRLRHTGTGRSVGWRYLDTMKVVEADGASGFRPASTASTEAVAALIREYMPGADGEADARTIAVALLAEFSIAEKGTVP